MVSTHMSPELDKFLSVYTDLSLESLDRLSEIYHSDIEFIDPAHRLSGLDELMTYFQALYQNVSHCYFDIDSHDQIGQRAYVVWTMLLSHPKLNKGQEVRVQGVTKIEFADGKVISHHDYFDLGAMLYEQLPLVGRCVSWIKGRLGQ